NAELSTMSQDTLMGTTVTDAVAEQMEPSPGQQAEIPLLAPTALATVTVFWTVPAWLTVPEANATAVCPGARAPAVPGINVKPLLSVIATLLSVSWPEFVTVIL